MSNDKSNTQSIKPATGKLALLLPGMGAIGTTVIAGVISARQRLVQPIGSLTQLVHMGDGPDAPRMRDALPLAHLNDIVFGGWDIFEENVYDAAKTAGVLQDRDLDPIREELEAIKPMSAVFDPAYIRNISGPNVKKADTKMALAEALIKDIEDFKAANGCDCAVSVWCVSTEVYVSPGPVYAIIEAFEQGLRDNHEAISPTMIYAYAHILAGVPFFNGAPNTALDCPAIVALAKRENVPVAGKDFKTGQTLIKTILAPGFASRMIGVRGWYSTNILGNRDGHVLDDPGSFKTKEKSKLSVLDSILDKEKYPEAYGEMDHKVRIDYYPPRGDNKEGWDNIDIFGWMNYPMQIKVNFLCRDSILAAPLVLDLALLGDLAARAGKGGIQDWLSFYFKAPQPVEGEVPEHDLFAQRDILFETLFALKACSEGAVSDAAKTSAPVAAE